MEYNGFSLILLTIDVFAINAFLKRINVKCSHCKVTGFTPLAASEDHDPTTRSSQAADALLRREISDARRG